MEPQIASGWGLATIHESGQWLDIWFPSPQLGTVDEQTPEELAALADSDAARGVHTEAVRVHIDLAAAPVSTADVWLRLHLLSHCMVKPREVNLDGIFAHLSNVVWTSAGPCAAADFTQTSLRLRRRGPVRVHGVDKFPSMLDYVVPPGVRIADASRVRLGAHLAPGTTVMHEGFVNFNAGTLGEAMVEGRISQGVVVGAGSDVGGGASIMGTLSGGGTEVVTVGRRTLLGANSGIAISLGDDCVVEAGLYVTAGTKVRLVDGRTVKAVELSGQPNLLFLRDSTTGAVVAKERRPASVALNADLHTH